MRRLKTFVVVFIQPDLKYNIIIIYWLFLHWVAKQNLSRSFAHQKIQCKHSKKGVTSYFA